MSSKKSVRLANTQKDMLVQELKAENYELRTRAQDYAQLSNRLVDVEQRAIMIREDKDKLEHELKCRAETDSLNISKLQQDNVRQRKELEDSDNYLARLKQELDALRNEADARTVDVSRLTGELNNKADQSATLRGDTDHLNRQFQIESQNHRCARDELVKAQDQLRMS